MNKIKKELVLDDLTKNVLENLCDTMEEVRGLLGYGGYLESKHCLCYSDDVEVFLKVCECITDNDIQICE